MLIFWGFLLVGGGGVKLIFLLLKNSLEESELLQEPQPGKLTKEVGAHLYAQSCRSNFMQPPYVARLCTNDPQSAITSVETASYLYLQ